MEPKYNLYQFVEVDGTYTGLGDLVGWIKNIEYCTVSNQYFYLIKVYGQPCETLYVAQRWLSISDRSQRLDRIINNRRILERHTK
jgi:hypothetical protein